MTTLGLIFLIVLIFAASLGLGVLTGMSIKEGQR